MITNMLKTEKGRKETTHKSTQKKLAVRNLKIPKTRHSSIIQRKPICVCDGGCPSCENEPIIQTRLKISHPEENYEKEADRIAEKIISTPKITILGCNKEEKKSILGGISQTKISNPNTSKVLPNFEAIINAFGDSGQSLPIPLQKLYGSQLNYDFSKVKIHTDTNASQMARSLNSRAFTTGIDIAFANGEYRSETSYGRRLIAHELTHVKQQQSNNFPNSVNMIQRKVKDISKQKEPQTTIAKEFSERKKGAGKVTILFPLGLKAYLESLNLGIGFISGFLDQFIEKAGESNILEFIEGLRDPENQVSFELGKSVGVIIGAGEGIAYNLEALFVDLPTMLYKLFSKVPLKYKIAPLFGIFAPAYISFLQSYEFLKDPEGSIEFLKRIKSESKKVIQGLHEFIEYIKNNPDALLVAGEYLGRLFGDVAAKHFIDYIVWAEDYYWKGMAVGEIIGLIALEVALLLISPEVWIISGAAKAGRFGTKIVASLIKGSKFGDKILDAIKKIPGLNKLFKAEKVLSETATVAGETATAGKKVGEKVSKVEKVVKPKAITKATTPKKSPPAAKTKPEKVVALKESGMSKILGKTVKNTLGELKFRGLNQNRLLRNLTHHEIYNAFNNTPFKPSNHLIKQLKDIRTSNMGVKTLNDFARHLNRGIIKEAGPGAVSIPYGRFETIINPQTKVIITFKPL